MKVVFNTYGAKVIWAVLIMMLLSQITAGDSYANQKLAQLQQKMADITLLKQQLNDHRQKAESVLRALLVQKEELLSEIRIVAKSLNIKNLDQAQHHLRIHYNIKLLSTLMAYVDEFDHKILFYQTGYDKLDYLHKITADDAKMVAALDDFQIDALTTQISLVINEYLPEAHAIQINPHRIKPISSQKVWNAVINPRD